MKYFLPSQIVFSLRSIYFPSIFLSVFISPNFLKKFVIKPVLWRRIVLINFSSLLLFRFCLQHRNAFNSGLSEFGKMQVNLEYNYVCSNSNNSLTWSNFTHVLLYVMWVTQAFLGKLKKRWINISSYNKSRLCRACALILTIC